MKEGSPIDEEAFERGTSVYLVDRVIPMLPEHLSNGLCSLKPDEDRLTYSVIATMDGQGNVRESSFHESVIRSRYRLTYQEAQDLIESKPPRDELKPLLSPLQMLRRLAKVLRQKRAARGSLDFDLPEARVELDEEGFPIDIQESVRLDSMRLIEEFMLLANETVARHATHLKVPFIYRVHDRPAPEKIDQIRDFVAALGYQLPRPKKGKIDPRVFAEIIDQARGKREEELVNTVILRSMKQARYQVDNLGHFGLAASDYTHFTSPIRRYPDLEVHRILKRIQAGERWKDNREEQIARLERIADHSSVEERNAVDAERDSIDLKKVEFMERTSRGRVRRDDQRRRPPSACSCGWSATSWRDSSTCTTSPTTTTSSTKTSTRSSDATRAAGSAWRTRCACGWNRSTRSGARSTSS